jgi:hypothetical protein
MLTWTTYVIVNQLLLVDYHDKPLASRFLITPREDP